MANTGTYTMTVDGTDYLSWNTSEDKARRYFDMNVIPATPQVATLVAPSGAVLRTWTPFSG